MEERFGMNPHSPAGIEESIWEFARAQERAACLATQNDLMRKQIKRLLGVVSELQCKVAVTEEFCASRQNCTQAAAAHRVARLEERAERQASTLEEVAEASEALASDNARMSSEIIQMKGERELHREKVDRLERRMADLQELYVRGLEECSASDSPTVRDAIRQRCLDELATEEVLATSRPPRHFPIPEPAALAKIKPALNEIAALRQQRDRLQQRESRLSQQVSVLQVANHDLSRQAATSRHTARQGASENQARMLGMVRRLKYLTQQMKKRENLVVKKDRYIRRLESQLVAQQRKIQSYRRTAKEKVAQQTRMSSRERRCTSVNHVKSQRPQDLGCSGCLEHTGTAARSMGNSVKPARQFAGICKRNSKMCRERPRLPGIGTPNGPSSGDTDVMSLEGCAQSPGYPKSTSGDLTGSPSSGVPSSNTEDRPLEDTLASIEEMEKQLRQLDRELNAAPPRAAHSECRPAPNYGPPGTLPSRENGGEGRLAMGRVPVRSVREGGAKASPEHAREDNCSCNRESFGYLNDERMQLGSRQPNRDSVKAWWPSTHARARGHRAAEHFEASRQVGEANAAHVAAEAKGHLAELLLGRHHSSAGVQSSAGALPSGVSISSSEECGGHVLHFPMTPSTPGSVQGSMASICGSLEVTPETSGATLSSDRRDAGAPAEPDNSNWFQSTDGESPVRRSSSAPICGSAEEADGAPEAHTDEEVRHPRARGGAHSDLQPSPVAPLVRLQSALGGSPGPLQDLCARLAPVKDSWEKYHGSAGAAPLAARAGERSTDQRDVAQDRHEEKCADEGEARRVQPPAPTPRGDSRNEVPCTGVWGVGPEGPSAGGVLSEGRDAGAKGSVEHHTQARVGRGQTCAGRVPPVVASGMAFDATPPHAAPVSTDAPPVNIGEPYEPYFDDDVTSRVQRGVGHGGEGHGFVFYDE
eukprot:evm.model.scf_66EXC.13 EVM.evm.TU.scf_66EXC.13   scf_66EXC:119393-124551(+)